MRTFILLSILLAASAARAAGGGTDEVGVVVTGESTMQPQLASQLEGWLKKHGHKLAPAPLATDAVNQIIDCFVLDDELCARKIVEKRSKAKAVVYARVDVQPGGDEGHTVTLFAYWFEKGHPAVAERRYCERCTDEMLRTTADDLMVALVSAGQKDTLGHLKLTSMPAGARIRVDDIPIGVTPLDYDLPSGPHKVAIQHTGHQSEQRDVAIRHGETTTVDVPLVAEPTKPRSKKTLLPLGVMGVGGALVVTGIIMVAIDQDPGPDQPFEIRNTGPSGVGIGIAGLAVGVGGYLWYRSMTKHESAPIAAITRDSAYVGWLARF